MSGWVGLCVSACVAEWVGGWMVPRLLGLVVSGMWLEHHAMDRRALRIHLNHV